MNNLSVCKSNVCLDKHHKKQTGSFHNIYHFHCPFLRVIYVFGNNWEKLGRHPYQSNSNCQVLHLSLFGGSYLGFRRPISGTRAIHGNFSLDICTKTCQVYAWKAKEMNHFRLFVLFHTCLVGIPKQASQFHLK